MQADNGRPGKGCAQVGTQSTQEPAGAVGAFRSGPDAGKKRRMTDRVRALPGSEAETRALLEDGRYVADDALVKTLFLSFALGRPLLLEGEAGCGKTQLAATLAETLGRRLLRLQCYEGLDASAAVYEWNYAAQMLAIRLGRARRNRARRARRGYFRRALFWSSVRCSRRLSPIPSARRFC